jgi:hypothetical protein
MKHLKKFNESKIPDGVISLSQYDFDQIYYNSKNLINNKSERWTDYDKLEVEELFKKHKIKITGRLNDSHTCLSFYNLPTSLFRRHHKYFEEGFKMEIKKIHDEYFIIRIGEGEVNAGWTWILFYKCDGIDGISNLFNDIFYI